MTASEFKRHWTARAVESLRGGEMWFDADTARAFVAAALDQGLLVLGCDGAMFTPESHKPVVDLDYDRDFRSEKGTPEQRASAAIEFIDQYAHECNVFTVVIADP